MVRRPVRIDPRVAKQDAKNAVKDPVDALIELITNSMDSYSRMKGSGAIIPKKLEGKVEVYLSKSKVKGERKTIIAVKDWAEGIAPNQMEKYISGYGGRTSGKETFQSIRGYFGRGLKDAAGGLDAIGTIYSVKDGVISVGIIDGSGKNSIEYEDVESFDANPSNMSKFHLDGEARTIATVEFPSRKLRMPRFGTFAEKLTQCVHLRNLMERGNIVLKQMDRGRASRNITLEYNKPKHTVVHSEAGLRIPGTTVTYNIVIRKAEVALAQGEEGKFREGGLLVMSGASVHEATLLKYERDPNSVKFFGEVRCDHIDELMQEDEPVVSPDREGLDWNHPFLKKLKVSVERVLAIYVNKEKKERDKTKAGISENALKRNAKMGRKLGKLYREIMKEERTGLRDLWGDGEDEKGGILIPESGFGFVPSFYAFEPGIKQGLRIVINSPQVIPSYANIEVDCDSNEVHVEKTTYGIAEGDYRQEEGVYVLTIPVMGRVAGVECSITASTESKSKETLTSTAVVEIVEPETYPPDGFAFVPDTYRIKVNRSKKIILKVDPNLVPPEGTKIELRSTSEYIIPEVNSIELEGGKNELIEKKIGLRGTKLGEKGSVMAVDSNFRDRTASAEIEVVSGRERPKGFVIEYDDTDNPIQRSTYSREEGKIFIFVKESTVQRYYGNGEYCDNLSFLVLCADLIAEAFCNRVVEDLREDSKIQTLGEDMETAISRKLNQLKRRFGPIIHRTYVPEALIGVERGVGR